MERICGLFALGTILLGCTAAAFGQSLGNAGTIEGTVLDPSGAAVARAGISIHNALTGYRQTALSAADGSFRLVNIPPNPYHLEATAARFEVKTQGRGYPQRGAGKAED